MRQFSHDQIAAHQFIFVDEVHSECQRRGKADHFRAALDFQVRKQLEKRDRGKQYKRSVVRYRPQTEGIAAEARQHHFVPEAAHSKCRQRAKQIKAQSRIRSADKGNIFLSGKSKQLRRAVFADEAADDVQVRQPERRTAAVDDPGDPVDDREKVDQRKEEEKDPDEALYAHLIHFFQNQIELRDGEKHQRVRRQIPICSGADGEERFDEVSFAHGAGFDEIEDNTHAGGVEKSLQPQARDFPVLEVRSYPDVAGNQREAVDSAVGSDKEQIGDQIIDAAGGRVGEDLAVQKHVEHADHIHRHDAQEIDAVIPGKRSFRFHFDLTTSAKVFIRYYLNIAVFSQKYNLRYG